MGLLDNVKGGPSPSMSNNDKSALALGLASGFAGMSGNPNTNSIMAGIGNQQTALRNDRKAKNALDLANKKSTNQSNKTAQMLISKGGKYAEIGRQLQAQEITWGQAREDYQTLSRFDMEQGAKPPVQKRITEGADGFKYYDDGTRVFPDAVAPDAKGTSVMQNYQFYKDKGKTDAEALTMATTVRQTDPNALTIGQKEVDKKYADDYILWQSSGGADMAGQLAQIGSVLTDLEKGVPLTGPVVGALGQWGDFALSIMNPKAANAKQQVQEVVQRNLKIILGAQFTAKEGEQLISRAYNDALPPAQNAARLRRLISSMQSGYNKRSELSSYYQDNNFSLSGYKGEIPTIHSMYSAISGFSKGQVITTVGKNGKSVQHRYLGGDHKKSSNWEAL